MQLFVCEAICGGWAGELAETSLRAEGAAMLNAAIDDFSSLPDCRVTTLWDRRLESCPIANAEVVPVSNPDEAAQMFRQLAAESGATFDIAPELDGLLLERRQIVVDAGGSYLGPTAAAIELCADKYRLAEHLAVNGIPTIDTSLSADVEGDLGQILPAVVKRRDGAGSLAMQLIRDTSTWLRARESIGAARWNDQMIVQPYIAGRALSTAAIIEQDAKSVEVFPAGEQLISDDGRFLYHGGRIPAGSVNQDRISNLVQNVVKVIPGLTGYVGFDILLPDSSPEKPLLVEINPRLTTSYLGFRAMAEDNLAERILFSNECWEPVNWKGGGVEFTADGIVRRLS